MSDSETKQRKESFKAMLTIRRAMYKILRAKVGPIEFKRLTALDDMPFFYQVASYHSQCFLSSTAM
jgi:hypothetical protein